MENAKEFKEKELVMCRGFLEYFWHKKLYKRGIALFFVRNGLVGLLLKYHIYDYGIGGSALSTMSCENISNELNMEKEK